jgi:hypothetical protein
MSNLFVRTANQAVRRQRKCLLISEEYDAPRESRFSLSQSENLINPFGI